MSLHASPEIKGGVLLSAYGEVHRDGGGETGCGKDFDPSRAAPVSHVQAIVFKLRLCFVCYPAWLHRSGPVGVAHGGRRPSS